MEIIIGLIILVAGVLQVILFFKIWSMTDDVKAMKNNFDSYDAYSIYAKTFAPAKAEEFLSSRPSVIEIKSMYGGDLSCTLSPLGGYEIRTVWNVLVKSESGDRIGNSEVTFRLVCVDSSRPTLPESWNIIGEPKARLIS